MKIDAFCQTLIRDLARFHAWWRTEHAKDPENFPLEMEEGNTGAWFEQFMAFCESQPAEDVDV